MTRLQATKRLSAGRRALFLGAVLVQLLVVGSRCLRDAFRKTSAELRFSPETQRAVLEDELLAVFGYFVLVAVGCLALVWYGRPRESDQAGLDFALLTALITMLALNAVAIIAHGASWTLPAFGVALLLASGILASVRRHAETR